MYCNPKLTAEEFKTIHNGLWHLENAISQLKDILKPELYVKLAQGASEIRRGLSGAYEQDRQASDTKYKHYRDVGKELGLTNSTWSAYEADNLSDCHPYAGANRVVYKDHWGDKPVSCSINGSTWAALWVAADACIRDSGDEHHVYIEQFTISQADPGTLILSTGS